MSEEKRVYVSQIKEALHLDQVCGDEESLKRFATVPDVNRPGLELAGYYDYNEIKRVIVIGQKEWHYIRTLDKDVQFKRFDHLTDPEAPCIVVTTDLEVPPVLLDIAKKKNFPIFTTKNKTNRLIVELISFLSEKTAPSDSYHGVMLNIYGKGVMLTGKSGIGKSEIALQLIKMGHIMVADDLVEITRVHNQLICTAPEILKRQLEVRGIGVIDVNLMFGGSAFMDKCSLDFIIKLVSYEEQLDNDRLNPTQKREKILGMEVPLLEIPVAEGKPMSVLVESAVTSFIIKENGIDMTEDFKRRIINNIKNKG